MDAPDAHDFEAFVHRFQDLVFATAVRLLGRPSDAEDAAQTVFLKAFERFDEIATSPAAAGWLRTVTRNVCLNHLSRYRRRWRLFSELEEGADADRAAAPLPGVSSPSRALEESERRARLEDAIRRLPDQQRVPLVLFHFEEMSYQDIATATGVSLGKVKTDIHRGRAALARLLTDLHGSR